MHHTRHPRAHTCHTIARRPAGAAGRHARGAAGAVCGQPGGAGGNAPQPGTRCCGRGVRRAPPPHLYLCGRTRVAGSLGWLAAPRGVGGQAGSDAGWRQSGGPHSPPPPQHTHTPYITHAASQHRPTQPPHAASPACRVELTAATQTLPSNTHAHTEPHTEHLLIHPYSRPQVCALALPCPLTLSLVLRATGLWPLLA